MAGVNGVNNAAILLLQRTTGKGKATASINASFSITAGSASPACAFSLLEVPYGSYSGRMGQLPKFTGLTKAEPQITEAELRDALIEMARADAASGKQYMSNGAEISALINKYICQYSPDRAGAVTNGSRGKMFPRDANCILARVWNEKTGEVAASYQKDLGWTTFVTKQEVAAADPFYELYYNTFFGNDSGTRESPATKQMLDLEA